MSEPAYDDSNLFAKILRDELPSERLIDNDDLIAIMDAMPTVPGHCLVIPKSPCRNLLDADPAVVGKVMAAAQKLAIATKTAFGADGVRVYQFNEAAAGQTIFHLHVHVVPVHEGSPARQHGSQMEDPSVLKSNADKIRAVLDA